ncbi:MAG: type II toxin-antitoxin system RelE/ParE family toxin [Sphingomonadaceae bacterium]
MTKVFKIVWTDQALDNLEEIVAYIEVFNPSAATRLGQRLIDLAESLCEFPDRGKPSHNGTREMSNIWPYLIRYRVNERHVEILHVRHGARLQDE